MVLYLCGYLLVGVLLYLAVRIRSPKEPIGAAWVLALVAAGALLWPLFLALALVGTVSEARERAAREKEPPPPPPPEPVTVCPVHDRPLVPGMARAFFGLPRCDTERRMRRERLYPYANTLFWGGCVIGEGPRTSPTLYCPICREVIRFCEPPIWSMPARASAPAPAPAPGDGGSPQAG